MADTSGVVVTATATELSPDPPVPPVPVKIGGEYKMKHYTAAIDFSKVTYTTEGSDRIYTFDYNVRDAVMQADEVNFTNLDLTTIMLWGGLVVSYQKNTQQLRLYIAGTHDYGFVINADAPNVIRMVYDPET